MVFLRLGEGTSALLKKSSKLRDSCKVREYPSDSRQHKLKKRNTKPWGRRLRPRPKINCSKTKENLNSSLEVIFFLVTNKV